MLDIVANQSIVRVRVRVVHGRSSSIDLLDDSRQDTLAVGAGRVIGGDWPGWDVLSVVEGTGVRLVKVEGEVVVVQLSVLIARLVGHHLEHVGVAVPSTKGWETPVLGNRRNGRVVVVEGAVSGSPQFLGDRSANENRENLVGDFIGLIFIEGDQKHRVVHHILIFDQRRHPGTKPVSGKRYITIMAIVCHVGSYEGPLRKRLALDIVLKIVKTFDLAGPSIILGNRVVDHQGIVFADIVVRKGLLV